MRAWKKWKSERRKKGQIGYLKQQKIFEIIRTIILLLLSGGIFLLGYFSTGTKENFFTIFAVVGLLPACKCVVNIIMLFMYPICGMRTANEIKDVIGELPVVYELLLTTNENTYPINIMASYNDTVIGFTQYKKCDNITIAHYVKKMLRYHGYRKITVDIFNDIDRYKDKLAVLSKEMQMIKLRGAKLGLFAKGENLIYDPESVEENNEILKLILQISL